MNVILLSALLVSAAFVAAAALTQALCGYIRRLLL